MSVDHAFDRRRRQLEPGRLHQGSRELLLEFGSLDFNRAELRQKTAGVLHVMQQETVRSKDFEQCGEADFARVIHTVKLTFGNEVATDAKTVHATDQFSVLPGFDAAGMTHLEQLSINIGDLRSDPRLRSLGTRIDDLVECRVNSDFETSTANDAPQALANMKFADRNRGSIRRAAPLDLS
jgi:hypothetical protein